MFESPWDKISWSVIGFAITSMVTFLYAFLRNSELRERVAHRPGFTRFVIVACALAYSGTTWLCYAMIDERVHDANVTLFLAAGGTAGIFLLYALVILVIHWQLRDMARPTETPN